MSAGGTIPGPQQQNPQPQNPSLPPADYSMGYARNFQTPSFYNPFSGYYGANQSYGGGFAQPFGGFGGFGQQFSGFQQPQYGGFEQPQFGGFQQPQYGGFQQPQYGGFQQPQYGGGFSQPSFRNPFGRGFNPRTMPPQMQPQPQPQPMPQPMPMNSQPPQQSGDLFSIGRPRGDAMPTTGGGVQMGPSEITSVKYVPDEVNNERDRADAIVSRSYRNPGSTTKDELAFLMDYDSRKSPVQVNSNYRPQTNMSGAGMYSGGGGYGGGFNPMMGGLGGFGGFFGY